MSSDSLPEKYNLVFRGELAKGVAVEKAKRNLAQLFKIDAAKVEALFSGNPTVLKRGLSADAANKYRVAIKKAGALVELVQDKPVVQGKAVFGPAGTNAGTRQSSSMGVIPGTGSSAGAIPGTESGSGNARKVGEQDGTLEEKSAAEGGLALAPLGAEVLSVKERKTVKPVEVDTSKLSVKTDEGNLLNDSEYPLAPPPRSISSDLSLAEAGADVLRPEERKPAAAAKVDISGLSLSQPGASLESAKPPPPPPPDVSRIQLQKH